jgi:hypothetical protein
MLKVRSTKDYFRTKVHSYIRTVRDYAFQDDSPTKLQYHSSTYGSTFVLSYESAFVLQYIISNFLNRETLRGHKLRDGHHRD